MLATLALAILGLQLLVMAPPVTAAGLPIPLVFSFLRVACGICAVGGFVPFFGAFGGSSQFHIPALAPNQHSNREQEARGDAACVTPSINKLVRVSVTYAASPNQGFYNTSD